MTGRDSRRRRFWAVDLIPRVPVTTTKHSLATGPIESSAGAERDAHPGRETIFSIRKVAKAPHARTPIRRSLSLPCNRACL
jgi:hypothetical protein